MAGSTLPGRWLQRGVALTLVLALSGAAGASAAPSEAAANFRSGQKAYNLGAFEEALADYSKAYEQKPLPEILFNIAQCQRQLGHFERAAFFYRRFLTLSPRPPANRKLVGELISEMESKQVEAERQAAILAEQSQAREQEQPLARSEPLPAAAAPSARLAEPAPSPSPPRPGLHQRWWFWAGLGVLAAAAGTTAVVATAPRPAPPGTLETIDAR